ncbi:cyclic pyranopterin monophosphate synthase subunit MoaA [Syntrophus gentianae]|uniref:GTP 3',8-cyclase n=1 Tax=Syntrophus gentianae TaxID=43775 RepID=A0A1H7YUV6_9BACT|nr:GTP 3',8-cyclase MoaA [Syntrophus gentianae]SEM49996.1 cyclic pyranopterin monophosphate synthase subunit MoaA [Syntrophus gentianae]
MLDTYNRKINYLRISVTDRCNLRCRYCMPEEGITKLEHDEILSLEDIVRLVRVGAGIGIRKIRLTGGEPLIRRHITQLIAGIREIPEIDDIAITTNGVLFCSMAEELKAAGLDRVNFSLDTMVAEKFEFITRRDHRTEVKKAIFKALELGLDPVKINTVAIKGFNDDEILAFAKLAYDFPLHIRFIEFMPIGDLLFWSQDRMISSEQIKERIEQRYELTPTKLSKGSGPAVYFKLSGGQGTIGFITPMSHKFCSECNRLRLTAEGKLRGCLYDKREIDLKAALESKSSDEDLKKLFIQAISLKPSEHHMNEGWGKDNLRKMSQIGG